MFRLEGRPHCCDHSLRFQHSPHHDDLKAQPEYTAAHFVKIGLFFMIATLTGLLADHERAQRHNVRETARRLAEVNAQLQKS